MKRRRRVKSEKKMDRVYLPSIKELVDVLYQEAFDRHWTWSEFARQSGLSYGTVVKLGTYETKYPQYRTVQLLAIALGGKVTFQQGTKVRKRNITWTPKVFKGRAVKAA